MNPDSYKILMERLRADEKNPKMIEELENKLKQIDDLPPGSGIIETSHPKFRLGLVAVDGNDERYVLDKNYKWGVAA